MQLTNNFCIHTASKNDNARHAHSLLELAASGTYIELEKIMYWFFSFGVYGFTVIEKWAGGRKG